MIFDKIRFQAGPPGSDESLEIGGTQLTVLLGPNNSGKTVALSDIAGAVKAMPASGHRLIVESVDVPLWSQSRLDALLEKMADAPRPGEQLHDGHIIVQRPGMPGDSGMGPTGERRANLVKTTLDHEATVGGRPARHQWSNLLGLLTFVFGVARRHQISQPQPWLDMTQSPASIFARLYLDDNRRSQLSDAIRRSIGQSLQIDPSEAGKMRLRLSDDEPISSDEARSLSDERLSALGKMQLVTETSEGIQAFIGLLALAFGTDDSLLLIDEPELFLHPPLAGHLGREIARAITTTSSQVVVATHSEHFLMGCVESGVPMSIVRLDYNRTSRVGHAVALDPARILTMLRKPLIRSTGVLAGLFAESVVVTEGDADRAFYQEINARMNSVGDDRATSGALFVNAQNKQTVWDIVAALRSLGVPAAGIVDIDVLKEGGAVWRKVLEGAGVPRLTWGSLETQRKTIMDAFNTSGGEMKTEGGVASLPKSAERLACDQLLDTLAEYGVFVVRGGELESWLVGESLPRRNKSKWLVAAFELMGGDPEIDGYMQPGAGDVWDFVGSVGDWMRDASRKGLGRP